ncbi:WD40 repeat-like protein [Eremomyces bilateralis CBS 781.70]|uniref:WD40 repeat-like protein n=1 Tax=Eremomyces bilateralis CBS 781.70 TaxID=1392243 RepID=A0A6G1G032_9PEZI|nr:WD40 repeat-like protein [Eremomyces bilateralis CBS 781.70]KAF1811393.1 WD40 repeat-like protein [Eremomyces bilateralis CBS 781.70]
MTAEILSSNVMNYLVWRYLQESGLFLSFGISRVELTIHPGYDSAAIQLSRAWCQHPDSLPFASNIKSHCLINLVQDGLWLDHLKAKVQKVSPSLVSDSGIGLTVGKTERRYIFGEDHGPRFAVRTSSRSGSESLEQRKSRTAQRGDSETNGLAADLSQVPGKGKRSYGTDRRSNGDAMEIDTNGVREYSGPERESPAAEQVPSTMEVGDSVALQSDKPVDLTQTTTFLYSNSADSTGANGEDTPFMQTSWSLVEPKLLTAAVENSIRYYVMDGKLPDSAPSTCSISLEQPVSPAPFQIENVCWTQAGDAFITGNEELGATMVVGKLFHLDQASQEVNLISPSVGTVMALRWNEKCQQLLVVSTSDVSGAIRIWDTQNADPRWMVHSPTTVMDAVWLSDTKFAVCGEGFIAFYDTTSDPAVQMEISTDIAWESLKFDPICELLACVSEGGRHLGIVSEGKNLVVHNTQEDQITIAEFQPIPNPSLVTATSPRLLATASSTGIVEVMNARAPFEVIHRFFMGGFPAYSMAFSPDGFLLAAAGQEALLVWNPEAGGLPKAIWKWPQGDRAWATESNGSTEVDEAQSSLCWDVDGKKIAYTLGHQIAVIDFR